MRLLFDENLSARLVAMLADVYPGSVHVEQAGLAGAPDATLWQYAATHGFVIVTKDEDFHRMAVLRGPPPKVVWVRLGNCSTADLARLLRFRAGDVARFLAHADAAFLAFG